MKPNELRDKIAEKCASEITETAAKSGSVDFDKEFAIWQFTPLITAALDQYAEGLREDREMLDWLLEKMTWWECWLSYDMDNPEIVRLLIKVGEKEEIGRGKTYREAVKAAMQDEEEGPL